MANKTLILIDNGHGAETPGKRSPDGSLREYAWAREVARMACDLLQAEGYNARLLVPEDRDVSLAERCRRANKYDKRDTILISIHNNVAAPGERLLRVGIDIGPDFGHARPIHSKAAVLQSDFQPDVRGCPDVL